MRIVRNLDPKEDPDALSGRTRVHGEREPQDIEGGVTVRGGTLTREQYYASFVLNRQRSGV